MRYFLGNKKKSRLEQSKITIINSMNPSAPDWILKFLNLFEKEELVDAFKNNHQFYEVLKQTGFIYGVTVSVIPKKSLGHLKYTKEEAFQEGIAFEDIINYLKGIYENEK